MRTWRIHELGDPIDNLLLEEVVDPEPGPGEVVLEVNAVGLAFPDVLQCRGQYQFKPPLPFTPGGETAGTVSAVGEGVTRFEPGQMVVGVGGGLAERVSISADRLFSVPASVPATKAAAIPLNYCTTWYALHDRAQLAEGETLLVTGAAGGTGSAAIQLGLAAGATVIAVAGGPEKTAACTELGAHFVVDHREVGDLVERVRELTDGKGVDVAYDPVGGEMFQQVRRTMGWNGRLLVIGFVGGIPDLTMNHVLLKNYSVVGVHWGASVGRDPESLGRQMSSLMTLAEDGLIDPLLHPVYGFEDGSRALQDIADRLVAGKVVVGTI